MVLGTHLILTAYGFWLPNDPRGSWSDFVGSWELARFGRATKVETHRSLAAVPHDRGIRLAAKRALKYPPVRLDGRQARAIGRGFGEYVARSGLTVWACAILPEHVHLVLGPHRLGPAPVANLLKGAATRRLLHEGIHPLAGFSTRTGGLPKAWARGYWAVFLGSPAAVRRAVGYVEANPAREGLPPQRWAFVTPYDR
ncbi:MAG TPA: transposase [Phycisphaerae bacterium]|nr:transposase [Phycisphaerae bacterium]